MVRRLCWQVFGQVVDFSWLAVPGVMVSDRGSSPERWWENLRYGLEYGAPALLYLVMEGGIFYTEMTGSYKTDRTQRACMVDSVARHPSVLCPP